MFSPLSVLSLHLACQLLASENSSVNVNLNPTTPKLAMELPSGYIVVPHFGAAYKHYNHRVSWNEARAYCAAEGGHLAVVDSYEKLQFLMDIKGSFYHSHVGFHKFFNKDEWTNLKTGHLAMGIPWRGESYKNRPDNRPCSALDKDGTGVIAIPPSEVCTILCEVPLFKELDSQYGCSNLIKLK